MQFRPRRSESYSTHVGQCPDFHFEDVSIRIGLGSGSGLGFLIAATRTIPGRARSELVGRNWLSVCALVKWQ